ncbi:MAG TPA: IMS domain-containing protein [Waterburya sp.]
MRIPLDYYRILGLPIQATAEQLSQAYRDRALQLPRREYSEAAIASRKQLLDEAYAVLSDPEQRAAYDASFLTKTYEQEPTQPVTAGLNNGEAPESAVDPYTPSIEIKHEQFLGALLILQELGEYELVLKLGQPYLGTRDSINLDKGRLGDPQLVRPDIVLTLALACLELGREEWQQGQYENAATSLETGQELLFKEGLFPSVRGEIKADLYKLRPYRILELVALPEDNVAERRQGLRLLQEMLQERMGIDGTGDDQSGLSVDDFLRFIQQLRGYLSAVEQQTLFETEARRPSAVATYLAVYALIARGFAQRQPALIARAKQLLLRLGRRQDVHLEQSVCALLLGQTEEASRALELSQEYEPLAFIREHSQGSPDLLPGLCLYGERWLQQSVFPHFRDLANQKASLKEYFADEQVQAYLETLPDSSGENDNEWAVVQSQQNVAYTTAGASKSVAASVASRRPDFRSVSEPSPNLGREAQPSGNSSLRHSLNEPTTVVSSWALGRATATATSSRTATLGATTERSSAQGVSTLPTSQQGSRTSAVGESTATDPRDSSGRPQRRQRYSRSSDEAPMPRSPQAEVTPGASSADRDSVKRLPPSRAHAGSDKSKSSAKVRRLIFLAIASVLGAGVLIWGLTKIFQGASPPPLQGEQPLVKLTQPPFPIPEPGSQTSTAQGPLTKETAKELIQVWLSTKSLAFGPNHQTEQLEQILIEPALSRSKASVLSDKQNNAYWQYKHGVEVNSVTTSNTNPDQARIDAAVQEAAQFYQDGEPNPAKSYNDNLRVQYDAVRRDGRWLIRDMSVVR